MTWDDLKIFTLQKIFTITGDTLVDNATTSPYLKSMPAVANEALQLLSTAGKYIIKSYDITQDGTDAGIVQKYDLSDLTTDFYTFRDVYLNDGEKYAKTNDFHIEGSSIFVIPSESVGTWTIYYNAYPLSITILTTGETELALDPEVAAIIPLYMASQLYKEDDLAMATMWRNEFEVARELLFANAPAPSVEITHTYEGW